jgi:squalene monooxygenase
MKALQAGTFHYFKLGGNCVNVPVGMLAGIIHRPWLLVYHGVAVALLSMWLMVSECAVWRIPFVALKSAVVFAKGANLLIGYVFCEFKA